MPQPREHTDPSVTLNGEPVRLEDVAEIDEPTRHEELIAAGVSEAVGERLELRALWREVNGLPPLDLGGAG